MTHPISPDRPEDVPALSYELRLMQTQAATGYFMPVPKHAPGFAETLAYLRNHPNDTFMHRYGLQLVMAMPFDQVREMTATANPDPVLTALLMEAILTSEALMPLQDRFTPAMGSLCRQNTPLLILRSEQLADQGRHRQWTALLKRNLQHHQPLPPLSKMHLPPLYAQDHARAWIALDNVAPSPQAMATSLEIPDFKTVYDTAMRGLERLGILAETEMRHESSLSPVALLRRWQMQIHIRQDRHYFHFNGLQTSYGKGLSLERARASCAMEIVERCSSFTSVVDGRLPDTAQDHHLRRARWSELTAKGLCALNPDALGLEVPYEDQPLYWIQGESAGGARDPAAILVPFQAVFLFSNLDEIDLFSGLGSTGLAAGGTLVQAKFHALLECIERDAEAVSLFNAKDCFRLASRDAAVGSLLADYRQRGIDVIFQDCCSGIGVPCYKCFVYGPGPNELTKGTSAHFAGWQAALSALTETPYPYPHGPASRPGPVDLPIRYLEALPDYSSDNMAADLQRLESLLAANQLHPVYVDLTRRDLAIPVVRALVPGLELMADYDRYARVSPRLYRNALALMDDSGNSGREKDN
jgi:ribosomal protein S12 methylthiotransferase accessory factor YcaO